MAFAIMLSNVGRPKHCRGLHLAGDVCKLAEAEAAEFALPTDCPHSDKGNKYALSFFEEPKICPTIVQKTNHWKSESSA